MAASQQPTTPSSIPISVFILGFFWAIGYALVAPGTLVFGEMLRWKPIDWGAVEQLAVVNGLLGIAAYWRKYAALLKLPPGFQEAKDLADGARVRTTTVATTGKADDPNPTVTTTIKETQVVPPEPKA